jgi:pimeloyl-ACP methyl ester carboxylesterase
MLRCVRHPEFRRTLRRAAAGIVVAIGVLVSPASASSQPNAAAPLAVAHEMLRVAGDGASYDLETLIVRPAGSGPWPIALLTHGTPVGGWAALRAMSPRAQERMARDLARRGWAVASVMRRGFGASGGGFHGVAGCREGDHAPSAAAYARAAAAYAADLAAVLDLLRRRPWADAGAKAIALGQSSGGFAALALAAERPRDVGAVFAFNPGGVGRPGTGQVCQEERLLALFQRLGGAARDVPTLWITGEDDEYLPAAKQEAWRLAWAASGGMAEGVLVPAGKGFRGSGHWLIQSRAAAATWMPAMDRFLRAHRLPTWDAAPAETALLAAGGAGWPAATRAAYADYLAATFAEKAFAATPDGAGWGYAGGLGTVADAEGWALRRCEERRPDGAAACALVAVNWDAPPH